MYLQGVTDVDEIWKRNIFVIFVKIFSVIRKGTKLKKVRI